MSNVTEIPTHDEIENGAHVNLSRILMSEEYLTLANLSYMAAQPVKEGSYAECSECHQMKMVHYMYGGKHPLCRQCFDDVTN
jgi:hypothetical protein